MADAPTTPTGKASPPPDPPEPAKNRMEFINWIELAPDSLVGSWFHVLEEGEIVWQGAVVGEPQAGKYLCHIKKLDIGAENVQRIIPIQAMENHPDAPFEFRFYDTEEAANAAFVAWETSRREREREAS